MHIIFWRALRYVLWFLFAVIIGAFLIGFAKFGFKTSLYIQYLNGISVSQIFSGDTQSSGTVLSGSDIIVSWAVESMEYQVFEQTGLQATWISTTGTTNESFGFVKNLETWYQDVEVKEVKAQPVSAISTKTVSGDSRKDLLNLIKSKEQ